MKQVLEQALAALEHITRRLQMDIDDGGRPDQWSMEDLVRKADPAIAALRSALSTMEGDAKDAQRYRAFFDFAGPMPVCFGNREFSSKEECDDAIDDALAAATGERHE
jgi:hypothetical protein